MSDIPRARELLQGALMLSGGSDAQRKMIRDAIDLLRREPPVSRAAPVVVKLTSALRSEVRRLSKEGRSQSEIARIVGLPNAGRVSEILTGKR